METACPRCSQRLRVSDTLQRPLLRCPSCGETFRFAPEGKPPRDGRTSIGSSFPSIHPTEPSPATVRNDPPQIRAPVAPPESQTPDTSGADAVLRELMANRRRQADSTAKQTSSWSTGAVGWIVAIAVFMLLNGGPKLAKQFLRKRQRKNEPVQLKNEPVQIREEQRRADQAVRDMEIQIAKERNLRERGPVGVPPPPLEGGRPQ